jgi:hypothetical protein
MTESRISSPDIRPETILPVSSEPPLRQFRLPYAQAYFPLIRPPRWVKVNVMLFTALHLPWAEKVQGMTRVVPDQYPATLVACA